MLKKYGLINALAVRRLHPPFPNDAHQICVIGLIITVMVHIYLCRGCLEWHRWVWPLIANSVMSEAQH